MPALGMGEESPGSTGIRCRLTAGGGDPRDSATENKPPARTGASRGLQVRVKRCGKSAPPLRQRRGQGKPHREQDRIGVAGGHGTRNCDVRRKGVPAPSPGLVARGARQRASQRNGRPRPRERPGQNPAYRPSGLHFPSPPPSWRWGMIEQNRNVTFPQPLRRL